MSQLLYMLKKSTLVSVLSCSFFFTFCLFSSLFFLDYRIHVQNLPGPTLLISWFKSNASVAEPHNEVGAISKSISIESSATVGPANGSFTIQSAKAPVGPTNVSIESATKVNNFVQGGGGNGNKGMLCDIFDGSWEWDNDGNYPLYQSRDCTFLGLGFRCNENGRADSNYTKWRWQPKHCNLPRFDARVMLEKLRGQRVLFVGDSLGRNQFESLICMLSSSIPNKASIYEVNRRKITKHADALVFKFRDYNCTVEYYRAPFLVLQSRAPVGAPKKVKLTLKLDKMDWSSRHWKSADLLVFNTGHWWNHEKTIRGGCYFQEGTEIKMEMSIENALRRSIETLMDWISSEVNLSKTHLMFRTYSPVHFRDAGRRIGCHKETVPNLNTSKVPYEAYNEFRAVMDVLSRHSRARGAIDLLDVTRMTSHRKDGHPSVYYMVPSAPLHRQDCSHWCLPGVPDAWNELLYASFLKRRQHLMKRSHSPSL